MEVDNRTKPNYISICIDDNKEYLEEFRKSAKEEDLNSEKKVLYISDNSCSTFEPSEFYYDSTDNELYFSGTLKNNKGETYISISLPLSEKVATDILSSFVHKFNKLKILLEQK